MEPVRTWNDADRVRRHTAAPVNAAVDRDIQECLEAHGASGPAEIERHLETLNREWDVERVLQVNASVLALAGLVLGATTNRRWLVVPGVVFSFFFQHAVQGWCPPIPVFRRMGVRTRTEINRERYALKALRGDFAALAPSADAASQETAAGTAAGAGTSAAHDAA
jgi:hypothetical protein